MDSFPVHLYVYDLSRGAARLLSQGLIGRQLDGIWHTSVVVYGEEWYFGQGIYCTAPGVHHYGAPVYKLEMGITEIPRDLFMDFLLEISSEFRAERYHLLEHNCNHFTERLCQFLIGKPIPSYIRNLPQDFLETPFGRTLKPVIDSMFGPSQRGTRMFIEPTQPILNTSSSSVTSPSTTLSIKFPSLQREAQTPYQIVDFQSSFWDTIPTVLTNLTTYPVSIDELKTWINDPIHFKFKLTGFINHGLQNLTEDVWVVLEVANTVVGSSSDARLFIEITLNEYLTSLTIDTSTSFLLVQALLKLYLRLFAHDLSSKLLSSSLSNLLEYGLNHQDPLILELSIQLCFNLSRQFFFKFHVDTNVSKEHALTDEEQEFFILTWFSGLIQLLSTFTSSSSCFPPLFYSVCFCLTLGYSSFKDLLVTFLPKDELILKKAWFLEQGVRGDALDEFYALLDSSAM